MTWWWWGSRGWASHLTHWWVTPPLRMLAVSCTDHCVRCWPASQPVCTIQLLPIWREVTNLVADPTLVGCPYSLFDNIHIPLFSSIILPSISSPPLPSLPSSRYSRTFPPLQWSSQSTSGSERQWRNWLQLRENGSQQTTLLPQHCSNQFQSFNSPYRPLFI